MVLIKELDRAIATIRKISTMDIEGVPQYDLLTALDAMDTMRFLLKLGYHAGENS